MKKIFISLAVLTVTTVAILAVNANNKLTKQLYANVEALAMGESTEPNGQLYSNSAGNLYCCKPGVADNCNTSVTPDCGFKR